MNFISLEALVLTFSNEFHSLINGHLVNPHLLINIFVSDERRYFTPLVACSNIYACENNSWVVVLSGVISAILFIRTGSNLVSKSSELPEERSKKMPQEAAAAATQTTTKTTTTTPSSAATTSRIATPEL